MWNFLGLKYASMFMWHVSLIDKQQTAREIPILQRAGPLFKRNIHSRKCALCIYETTNFIATSSKLLTHLQLL
jgi:hypothetical protein